MIIEHNQRITDSSTPTRDRLLAAGLRLFAERGFRETTVGEIEAAVGLQPRRGALYRHFRSKEELLEAAVTEQLDRIEHGLGAVDDTAAGDPLDSLMVLGRWFLMELDAAEPLVRVLEHDRDRLLNVRDTIRAEVIDAGHRRVSALIRSRAGDDTIDADAISTLIIGPLANHRRTTWTFGAAPLGVDDERLLRAWQAAVTTLVTAIRSSKVVR